MGSKGWKDIGTGFGSGHGTNALKHFMWLCALNQILTNMQRKKRNFTFDALCPICKIEEESVTHASGIVLPVKMCGKCSLNLSNGRNFLGETQLNGSILIGERKLEN